MSARPQNRRKAGVGNRTTFKPGQSGNPGGRPKVSEDVKEAYRAMHPRAVARLAELLESKDEAIALRACVTVIERVEGRPAAAHEISITRGKSLEELVLASQGTAGKTSPTP